MNLLTENDLKELQENFDPQYKNITMTFTILTELDQQLEDGVNWAVIEEIV